MTRADGLLADQIRPVQFQAHFTRWANCSPLAARGLDQIVEQQETAVA